MKKYNSYKDSGIEWMGVIPSNWKLIKNRYGFQKHKNGKNESDDTSVLSLTIKGVKVKTNLNFGKSTESYIGHQLVEEGDIVFTPRDFDQTPILSDVSKYNGCISNLYIVDKTKEDVLNHYVNYYWYGLKYSVDYFKNFSHGMRYSFNRFQFDEIPLLKPTLSEQQKIVTFLDTKTSHIDSLIDKTQLKIELLKEKRTSVINKVVTKGLNPNVKMKDSGVEWIGEIPICWDFLKLWLIIQSSELGGNYNGSTENDGIPMMKMGNIDRGKITLKKVEFVEEPFEDSHLLKKGDFLFNTRNSIDLVGKVCIWRNELEKSIYNSNILRIIFKKDIDVEFMNYLFNSKSILDVLRLISKGTTSVSGIYYKDLSKIKIPIPSISEQQQIVEYLDEQTQLIDKTISIEEKRIELLEEYRKSLISEVVTGKRKVD